MMVNASDLRSIERTHDYKFLVLFLFPLAGAYIGVAYLNRLRRVGQPISN